MITLFISQAVLAQKLSLVNPQVVGSKNEDLASNGTLFCWGNNKLGVASFLNYEKGEFGFCKVYIDSLPNEIDAKDKSQFKVKTVPIDEKEHTIYVLNCGKEFIDEINIQSYFNKKQNTWNSSYQVIEPLNCEHSLPQNITCETLISFLRAKRAIFYTGAGISVAAGVSTMENLTSSLGLNNQQLVDKLTQKTLKEGKAALSSWDAFCRASFSASPTKAHSALAKLALAKNMLIFTENIDRLHERAGVRPVRPTRRMVLEEIDADELGKIDYIVCIGLSRDDKGFLAYYKLHNTKGKIVAIDLKSPTYLSDNDYFVEGDLQKIVPYIANQLLNK